MSRRERQRRKRRNQAGPHRLLFTLLGVLAVGVLIGGGVLVGWIVSVANDAPTLDTSKRVNLGASSRVYAADGKTSLGVIQADIVRFPISGDQIPDVVRNATVAVEDRRFYKHKGVDFEGIVRAAVKNFESKKDVQGGSTLTMQLVRNLYTGERARQGTAGYKRKIREAKLAQELEDRHPGRAGKQWILNQYVNSVPYGTVGGQTAVGIQAASRIFFDKPASQLRLHEAALLAGLPQAPSLYNPFLDRGRALTRRNEVLQRMADQHYITQAQAHQAMQMPIDVKPNRFYSQVREGYFFDYVKQLLVDRYGLNVVRQGGLRIHTTIDLRMQRLARQAMVGQLGAPDRAGAIVTIDPATGYIKAMASSSNYADSKFNLAAQGNRQAGSTFKVMVLMAALRHGVDPNSTSYVSRHLAPGWLPSAPSYEVQTFSHSYRGRINLVQATLASDNSVYAQLDADIGPEEVTRAARDMGITSPLHSYPAEGLGGLTNGVSPLEMARAYATIANGGYRVKPIPVLTVTFPDGHVDDLGKPQRVKVFDDGVTYEATKILEQNVQGGTGVAAQIGCPAAGKTGTVDNFTDAWFVGFTPRLVSSVWVGHPKDPYTLGPNAQGGTVAAPIWGRYMKAAHGSFCGQFPQPKVPFVSQPFQGKYAQQAFAAPDPTAADATKKGKGTKKDGAGKGGNGTGGGGTKYPPDQYTTPPAGQQPPGTGTATPPAQGQGQGTPAGGQGGGGAAAPG
jgi:penicillin-binding protein 1A